MVQLLFCLPFSFLSTFRYYSCGSFFLLILGAGYFIFLFISDAVLSFFAYMLLALRPSLCTLPDHLLFDCSGPVGRPVLLPVPWGSYLLASPIPPTCIALHYTMQSFSLETLFYHLCPLVPTQHLARQTVSRLLKPVEWTVARRPSKECLIFLPAGPLCSLSNPPF